MLTERHRSPAAHCRRRPERPRVADTICRPRAIHSQELQPRARGSLQAVTVTAPGVDFLPSRARGSLQAGVHGRAGVLAGSHAAAPALRLPTRPGCEAGNTSGRPWAAGRGRSVRGGGFSG